MTIERRRPSGAAGLMALTATEGSSRGTISVRAIHTFRRIEGLMIEGLME